MGNFVAVHVLKQYNPGTFNRGETGEAKQVMLGGTNRARFSSQCQKKAIREFMACEEIRSSHIEDLVSSLLDVKVADNIITEAEKDMIGEAICSKEVLGIDPKLWKNLTSDNPEKASRVVVTTNLDEITSLINAFIKYIRENNISKLTGNMIKEIAKQEGENGIKISVAKALFGTMATDGVLGTVDGALQMGQAYSVDEFRPESDFFSVRFVGRADIDKADPFFDAFDSFVQTESAKAEGETINEGLALNANLMYSYANINLKEFQKNLDTFVFGKEYQPSAESKDIILNTVPDFVQAMIEMVPEATQNRSSSHVAPAAVLIEVIEDGANIQPDWSDVITRDNKQSITQKAVSKLAAFAEDKTFRSGNIKQFVMLSADNQDLAEQFTGIQQIKSFAELKSVLGAAIEPLIKTDGV